MNTRKASAALICVLIALSMLASGCIFFNSGNTGASPTPGATPAPTQAVTPTIAPTPTPTGLPAGTVTPTATPSPGQPAVRSAETSGWSTDRDTYTRGDTATGGVTVKNTGNVPIDQIDFKVVISRTVFFIPYSQEYSYSATGLNIKPGESKRVEFSQAIPAEYSGVSTAGDYKMEVTASLGGNTIGSFSKDIRVV